MNDDDLYHLFYPGKFRRQRNYTPVDYAYVHKELPKTGVTETLFWEEYSTEHDFNRIMEIYCFVRKHMAEHGNPNQWGPANWPPEELIHRDISAGNSYVCINDEGTVIGTFFFIYGTDIESTYRDITDGAWLDDSPYGVVHRIAGDGSEKGNGTECILTVTSLAVITAN